MLFSPATSSRALQGSSLLLKYAGILFGQGWVSYLILWYQLAKWLLLNLHPAAYTSQYPSFSVWS